MPDRQRKAFIAELKTDEGGTGLTATVSTKTPDRDGDVIDPRLIDVANFLGNPICTWAHSYRDLPVGRWDGLRASDSALVGHVEWAPHGFARTVGELYTAGYLRAFSIGFLPLEAPQRNEHGGVDFGRIELLEIAAVPVPANPQALTIGRAKGLDLEQSALLMLGRRFDRELAASENADDPTGLFRAMGLEPGAERDEWVDVETAARMLRAAGHSVRQRNAAPAAGDRPLFDQLNNPDELTPEAFRALICDVIEPAIDAQIRKRLGRLD